MCAFYRGVGGRDEVLVPYLREGLRAGEKCIAVVDEDGRDDLLTTMAREPESDPAQLDVRTLAEAYLRTGTFVADEMIQYWNTEIPASLEAGSYATARIAGEGSWAFADARTSEEIVRYEGRPQPARDPAPPVRSVPLRPRRSHRRGRRGPDEDPSEAAARGHGPREPPLRAAGGVPRVAVTAGAAVLRPRGRPGAARSGRPGGDPPRPPGRSPHHRATPRASGCSGRGSAAPARGPRPR